MIPHIVKIFKLSPFPPSTQWTILKVLHFISKIFDTVNVSD